MMDHPSLYLYKKFINNAVRGNVKVISFPILKSVFIIDIYKFAQFVK